MVIIMKNIPVFTESGASATLDLQHIDSRKTGYIIVQTCDDINKADILRKSAGLLNKIGAVSIYACSQNGFDLTLENIDICCILNHSLIKLKAELIAYMPDAEISTYALNEENVQCFLEIYNEAFNGIINSKELNREYLNELLPKCEGRLYGNNGNFQAMSLTRIESQKALLMALAAKKNNLIGKKVLRVHLNALYSRGVKLVTMETQTNNEKAITLFKNHGFVYDRKIMDWYQIIH